MRLRASGSDLTVFHILAEEDVAPDFAGDLMLVDREGGERLTVSVTEDIARSFRDRVALWQKMVRSNTRGVGGVYLPIRPDEDIEVMLLNSWRDAGVIR